MTIFTSTELLNFKTDCNYLPKPSVKFNICNKYRRLLIGLFSHVTLLWDVVDKYTGRAGKFSSDYHLERSSCWCFIFLDYSAHSAAKTKVFRKKTQVLCLFPQGHIKQLFLVKSQMHTCFSIRWMCSGWKLCCLNKPELPLFNPHALIWILLKMQAPLMLSLRYKHAWVML